MPKGQKQPKNHPNKLKLYLIAVVILLVVIAGLVLMVLIKSPVTSASDADKFGKEVTQNIEDIKTALNDIKDNLKAP